MMNAETNTSSTETNTSPAAVESLVYYVTDLSKVETKFAKLAKRAKKLGVAPVGFEKVGEHHEYQVVNQTPEGTVYTWERAKSDPMRTYTGAVRLVHHVILTGVSVVKLNGWRFLATLDHELGSDNTVVRLVPGTEGELPTDYRHRGNACDHCHRSVMRKATYVCKHDDGRLVQVGSTCVRDFLGHDAAALLGRLEMAIIARDALSAEEGGGSGRVDLIELTEYLAWVAKDIREHGWVSRKDADIRAICATADAAFIAYVDHGKH